jgi:hypothetical protein
MTDPIPSPDPAQPAPDKLAAAPDSPRHHSVSRVDLAATGSCIQEWTGSAWVVVEVVDPSEGFQPQALDPARVRGRYLGERVVTACVKA